MLTLYSNVVKRYYQLFAMRVSINEYAGEIGCCSYFFTLSVTILPVKRAFWSARTDPGADIAMPLESGSCIHLNQMMPAVAPQASKNANAREREGRIPVFRWASPPADSVVRNVTIAEADVPRIRRAH